MKRKNSIEEPFGGFKREFIVCNVVIVEEKIVGFWEGGKRAVIFDKVVWKGIVNVLIYWNFSAVAIIVAEGFVISNEIQAELGAVFAEKKDTID